MSSGCQWAILLTLVVSLLLFDLLVLHRTPKVLSTKPAAIESMAWPNAPGRPTESP
jgi:hypothetical protein